MGAATVALVMSIETLQLLVQPYQFDEGGSTRGFLAWPHVGLVCCIGSMPASWWGAVQRD